MSVVTREEFDLLKEHVVSTDSRVEATCDKMDKVLINHIPHINAELLSINTKIDTGVKTTKWLVGIGFSLIAVLLSAIAIVISL